MLPRPDSAAPSRRCGTRREPLRACTPRATRIAAGARSARSARTRPPCAPASTRRCPRRVSVRTRWLPARQSATGPDRGARAPNPDGVASGLLLRPRRLLLRLGLERPDSLAQCIDLVPRGEPERVDLASDLLLDQPRELGAVAFDA